MFRNRKTKAESGPFCPSMVQFKFAVFALALTLGPSASNAQDAQILDQPRSLEIIDGASGYEYFSPERFGPLTQPNQTELGVLLVLRMLRNVCLGLGAGQSIDEVKPAGFTAFNSTYYLLGPDSGSPAGTDLLSPTGDPAMDEQNGHPVFWLKSAPTGMSCSVDWRFEADLEEGTQRAIETIMRDRLPWELSLIPAEGRLSQEGPPFSDATEWDRPCQGRWCPVTAAYALSWASVSVSMILNIDGIEGQQP